MPPHNPMDDPSVTFVRARVLAVSGTTATVSNPGRVTFEILEVTRAATSVGWVVAPDAPYTTPSPMPRRVEVVLGATRSLGQERFHLGRANLPDEAERIAALGQRGVLMPTLGSTVFTWLTEVAPGTWAVSPDEPRWRDEAQDAAGTPSLWTRVLRRLGLR